MISRAVLIAVALARFLYIVAAHGGVSDYVVGEKWYKGYVNYLTICSLFILYFLYLFDLV